MEAVKKIDLNIPQITTIHAWFCIFIYNPTPFFLFLFDPGDNPSKYHYQDSVPSLKSHNILPLIMPRSGFQVHVIISWEWFIFLASIPWTKQRYCSNDEKHFFKTSVMKEVKNNIFLTVISYSKNWWLITGIFCNIVYYDEWPVIYMVLFMMIDTVILGTWWPYLCINLLWTCSLNWK